MKIPVFILFCFLARSVILEDIKDFNVNDLIRLFQSVSQFKPRDVKARDVTFYLFTRNGSWNNQIHVNDNQNELDTNKSTKIVIHGWIDNHNRSWYKNLTDEYLKNGDFNIIQVDWGRIAQTMYISSAQNARLVGKYIAKFVESNNIPPKSLHIIGHSLGAHVAGFAARDIQKFTGEKVERITGLDPAGPFFRNTMIKENYRLNAGDAKIVDVFHTDGGFYGYFGPIGTFDIYINGGTRIQPDCQTTLKGAIPIGELIDDTYCSHTRSYIRYIEIINEKVFTCHKCDSWFGYFAGFCNLNENYIFGAEDIDEKMRGVCFVKTY